MHYYIIKKLFYPDREESILKKVLLFPIWIISFIFGLIVRLRKFLYNVGVFSKKSPPCDIISVGNLTIGGGGKTSAVIYLAEMLMDQGLLVGILSRGYKGKNKGLPMIVSLGEKTLLEQEIAGDEPYLMAEKLKGVSVFIGRDRFKSVSFALKISPFDCFIMDDGFSHLRISRSLDILVINGRNGFGNGYLLPRGPLREPLKELKRVSVFIIINNKGSSLNLENLIKCYNSKAGIFYANYIPQGFRRVINDENIPLYKIKKDGIISFAGIAHPDSLLETMKEMGVESKAFIPFPDHYKYKIKDLEKILLLAKNKKVKYIGTTEKDAVRIKPLIQDSEYVWVKLCIKFFISDKDEEWRLKRHILGSFKRGMPDYAK